MELRITGKVSGLRGRISPPGDKSLSHRTLLLGAMANGPTRLRGWLNAGVTQAMLSCIHALGIDTEFVGPSDLLILGGPWRSPATPLECGNSGTTMRMLLGALAGYPITATLQGSPGLHRRPMGRVTGPLRQMGTEIQGAKSPDEPPLTVRGGNLHGIEYRLPVASAQVKTALLLAALRASGPTTLHEPGPSRDHTERLLQELGISLTRTNGTITLDPDPNPLPAFTLTLPGDFSSAAFLLTAAALVPGSEVILEGVGVNPTRIGLLEVLSAMGAEVGTEGLRQEGGEPVANLHIWSSDLEATRIEGDTVVRMIDEFPILAVAATQAQGESQVRGAAELRHKESDRIAAVVMELRKMGAEIDEQPDGFDVQGPTPLRGAVVDSHGDHRLAMALTVAGLVAEGSTTVQNADVVNESYPGFGAALSALGVELG